MIHDQIFLELTKRVEPFVENSHDVVRYEVNNLQRIGIRFSDSFISSLALRYVFSICKENSLHFYVSNTCCGFKRGDMFIVIYDPKEF